MASIEVADDQFEAGRGDAEGADASIEIDADTLAAVLWDRLPLADAQRSRRVMVEGDQAAAERLGFCPFPNRRPHDADQLLVSRPLNRRG